MIFESLKTKTSKQFKISIFPVLNIIILIIGANIILASSFILIRGEFIRLNSKDKIEINLKTIIDN